LRRHWKLRHRAWNTDGIVDRRRNRGADGGDAAFAGALDAERIERRDTSGRGVSCTASAAIRSRRLSRIISCPHMTAASAAPTPLLSRSSILIMFVNCLLTDKLIVA
jgi:hypothetical protein